MEVETRAPRAFATTGAHLTAAAACAIDIDIVCLLFPRDTARARQRLVTPDCSVPRDDDEVYLILNDIFLEFVARDWANRQQSNRPSRDMRIWLVFV